MEPAIYDDSGKSLIWLNPPEKSGGSIALWYSLLLGHGPGVFESPYKGVF